MTDPAIRAALEAAKAAVGDEMLWQYSGSAWEEAKDVIEGADDGRIAAGAVAAFLRAMNLPDLAAAVEEAARDE